MKIKILMILLLVGSMSALHASAQESCATLAVGSLIKVPDYSAVYYINENNQRMYFPNGEVYSTWFDSYDDVITVSSSCIDNYASGGGINYRSGTVLIKTDINPAVYAIEPGNIKRKITTEEVASALYGIDWAKKVRVIPDVFDANYTKGNDITVAVPHSGQIITYDYSSFFYVDGDVLKPADGTLVPYAQYVSKSLVTQFEIVGDTVSRIDVFANPAQNRDKIQDKTNNDKDQENTLSDVQVESLSDWDPDYGNFFWDGLQTGCGDGICSEDEDVGMCHVDCNPLLVNQSILTDGQINVSVPSGYEVLGRRHLEDLKNCIPLISEFLGITPLYSRLNLTIAINDRNRGYSDGRFLFYDRTQENIDRDLEHVLTNNPDGFLANVGPEHCVNTHELTHVFMGHIGFMPSWMGEGIAEFTQKHIQDAKNNIVCTTDGIYRQDFWSEFDPWTPAPYKTFKYLPFGSLRPSENPDSTMWYASGMCFWQHIFQEYGWRSMKDLIAYNEQNSFGIIFDSDQIVPQSKAYLEDILKVVLGDEIETFLEQQYGIEYEEPWW